MEETEVIIGKGIKLPNRVELVLNKHGKMRIDRKYQLMQLVDYLMDRNDSKEMFRIINFNTSLLKEERDYMSDIYNEKIKE